jgi:hypothetical protein
MCKRYLIQVAILSLCVLAWDGAAADEKMSDPITKFGEYTVLDGNLILKVSEGDGKLTLSLKLKSKPNEEFSTSLTREKGTFWLVYPETANKVWLFQNTTLWVKEVTQNGSKLEAISGSEVLKKAPKKLLDAIPKEVRDRLKGK